MTRDLFPQSIIAVIWDFDKTLIPGYMQTPLFKHYGIDEDRRVPFANMLYIADGPSDVPVFSVVKRFGGKTYAVYPAGDEKALKQVDNLRRDNRVDTFGEANYRPGSQTHMWITMAVREIADKMVEASEKKLQTKVGKAPKHIT